MNGYPETLKYFIWPFQVHYRISCEVKSESLFNHFDRGLFPKVLLLGFLFNTTGTNSNNRPLICFDPEEVDHFEEDFHDLKKTILESYNNHPDKNMFYTGKGMQEKMDLRLEKESTRIAIEKKLNQSKRGIESIFFVSKSTQINDYSTYVVLVLNKLVYQNHTHLKTEFFQERIRIYRSVLETAIKSFLTDCENNLNLPSPGESLSRDSRNSEELLREAAHDFMYTISSKGGIGRGLHGLFNACNAISIHRYEGKENVGQIIIAEKNHPSIEYTLTLDEPFELRDYRKSRKMLQLTNKNLGIICDSYEVLGLGSVKQDYDIATESLFTIRFNGIHCWEVWHKDQPVLTMKYGLPQFLNEIINRKTFFSDCLRLFSKIDKEQVENLYNLSVAATSQKNGALLIITNNAEQEAKRLSKQSIVIKPVKLSPSMIQNLTSIDGGILINPEGFAFAQGVILDGIVSNKGNSARGSRYNSAITYYDFKGAESPTLIVVVSEDGMVDIIPYLRPQISRFEIQQVIDLLIESKNVVDSGTFNKAMQWLSSRSFYLSQEQCDAINSIRKEMDENHFEMVRIVYQDLEANPDMNDSYFLD